MLKPPGKPKRSTVRGVFVTGTGTGVGKTVIAMLVAAAARRRKLKVAVFKPAVTGLGDSTDGGLGDHQMLAVASGSGQSPEEVTPYRFGPACSPHLAAELCGNRIDPAHLQAILRAFEREGRTLIVEGIGGLMVPLTPGYLVRDLAVDAALPLVVAARPGLGTLNHTLMTLEAARTTGLKVAGIVLTPWPDDPDVILRDNVKVLKLLGGVEVHVLPPIPAEVLAAPTPGSLAPLAERLLPLDRWMS